MTGRPPEGGDGDARVALVVVSHSRPLAEAAVGLATQMVQGRPVTIEVAAGTADGGLGTDAVAIMEAVRRADGPAGVVVLMDLGSAVLSAELALELLGDPGVTDRVVLSSAPLVEGLVGAAVAAAGGATRDEVAAEARAGLLGKQEHLGTGVDDAPAAPATPAPEAPEPTDDAVRGVFRVANPHGLHARPAARLVEEVRALDARVELRDLTAGTGPVPGGSLSRLATLGVRQGHEVEVVATGPRAAEAVKRVLALAARRFDEPEPAAGSEAPSLTQSSGGEGSSSSAGSPGAPPSGPLPGAPGIAVGPLRRLVVRPADGAPPGTAPTPGRPPAAEWARLVEALDTARVAVEHARALTLRSAGAEEAAIFTAHLALLDDPELVDEARRRVDAGAEAPTAWGAAIDAVERAWRSLPDAYLRERADDVRAVGDQVLRALVGGSTARMESAGVLVARDLTPADTAELDLDLVEGIVLAQGSPTSHAAILARARGLPLVVGAGDTVLRGQEGTMVALDGSTGEVYLDPRPEVLAGLRRRAATQRAAHAAALTDATRDAVSLDGVHVVVAANVGSVADARAARGAGADGAGLVRTEFLFLGRTTAPTPAEQEREYLDLAEALGGRRVTLRTLDVGGDKPLGYLPQPHEDNPFLGRRGLRLGLAHADLLRGQLEAVVATARQTAVDVMFPMVSVPSELEQARALLREAAGGPLPPGLRVGMMVEVPAAALKVAAFLPLLDFVSIGTNDLTQYALAAERGNPHVARLFDPLDPGVLRLVDAVCRGVDGRVGVAVCGESASDPLAIPLLVGLGVRELSVSPPAVPEVKAAVRRLDTGAWAALAATALRLDDAAAVRRLVRERMGG